MVTLKLQFLQWYENAHYFLFDNGIDDTPLSLFLSFFLAVLVLEFLREAGTLCFRLWKGNWLARAERFDEEKKIRERLENTFSPVLSMSIGDQKAATRGRLIEILIYQKRYGEAAAKCALILRNGRRSSNPTNRAILRYQMAELLAAAGDKDAAKAEMRRVELELEALCKEDSNAWTLMIQSQFAAAKMDHLAQIELLRIAMRAPIPASMGVTPNQCRALLHIHLGLAFLSLEAVEEAMDNFREAAQVPTSLPTYMLPISYFLMLGSRAGYDFEDALKQGRAAVDETCEDPQHSAEVLIQLGLTEMEMGNLQRAHELAEKVLVIDDSNSGATFLLAYIYWYKQDFLKTQEFFSRTIELLGDSEAAWKAQVFCAHAAMLGMWHRLEGVEVLEQAREACTVASSHIPRGQLLDLLHLLVAAEVLALGGDKDGAMVKIEEYLASVEVLPENFSKHRLPVAQLGDCYRALNEPEKAKGAILKALERGAPVEKPGLHYQLGELFRQEQDLPTARYHWQHAVDTGLDIGSVQLAKQRLVDYPVSGAPV